MCSDCFLYTSRKTSGSFTSGSCTYSSCFLASTYCCSIFGSSSFFSGSVCCGGSSLECFDSMGISFGALSTLTSTEDSSVFSFGTSTYFCYGYCYTITLST